VSEARYLVPALARGLDILALYSRERPSIGPAEMARALKLPRSTVFRLVQTLEAYRLLEREAHGNSFRLGAGITRLGFGWLASLDIAEIGRPVIEALRDRTGRSCHLAIRDGAEGVVVARAGGHCALTGSFSIGSRVPAHAAVLGRMLLLDLPEAELAALFPGPALPAFSPQTPRTLAELRALLAEDRARGHAISRGHFESGVSAVAAPVRDAAGRVVGSLNATLFGGDAPDDALIAAVREAGAELGRALGAPVAAAA